MRRREAAHRRNVREQCGRWYASVLVGIELGEYFLRCGTGALGMALRLRTFATVAYPDEAVENALRPKPLMRGLRPVRRSQGKLGRCN